MHQRRRSGTLHGCIVTVAAAGIVNTGWLWIAATNGQAADQDRAHD
ncbi:MAG: hypothetical protein H3C34_29290 [Caldilineaceae bacterium]|nr:hypothetical protein [Caldilineaceae bacterium]